MARRYGRAKRGSRCVAAVPHGHWKTTTFTGALRLEGMTAPMALDGPMNARAFRAYVEQALAPTLKPGDVVVMDNLAAHKNGAIRAAIEAAGASLGYLPPYSPDLNPIETPSPSSRPPSARPQPAPSRSSGTPSQTPFPPSPQPNAQTTSPPQDTNQPERILL